MGNRNTYPVLSPQTRFLVQQAHDLRKGLAFDAAESPLSRALNIDPRNPLLSLELAHLRLASGHYTQAETFAEEAESLSNIKDVRVAAQRVIAESLRQRGRGAEAQSVETRLEELTALANPTASSTPQTHRDATIRATITAVARSQPDRIGIEYAPVGRDFAVRIGDKPSVRVTRSDAQALLGDEALRHLDATLQTDRTLSDPDLHPSNEAHQNLLSESVLRQRFIDVPTKSALAQLALAKLTGSADINALRPSEAMRMLTGMPSTSISLPEAKEQQPEKIYDQLRRAINAGSPITLRSQAEYPGAKQDTLVDNRTYTLTAVTEGQRSGAYELTLRNPWGKYLRVDLQTLIRTGGLDSITIGASTMQQRDLASTAILQQPSSKLFEAPAAGAYGVMLQDSADELRKAGAKFPVARAPSPAPYITVSRGKMFAGDKAGEQQELPDADPKGLPAGIYYIGNAVEAEKGARYQGMVVYSRPIADSNDSQVFIQKDSTAGTGTGRQYVAVRMRSEQVPDNGQVVRIGVGESRTADSVGVIDPGEKRVVSYRL